MDDRQHTSRFRIKDGAFDGHPAEHYIKFCVFPRPLWTMGDDDPWRHISGRTKWFSPVLFCIQLLGDHIAWEHDQDKIERARK